MASSATLLRDLAAFFNAPNWQAAVTVAARQARAEIQADVAAGIVPVDVRDFSHLHDFVDANGYGGAFRFPFRNDDTGDDVRDQRAYVELYWSFWDDMQTELDAWLRAGRPDVAE